MESDMVVAVRHRVVPGDLTRSSTCNKNATPSLARITIDRNNGFAARLRRAPRGILSREIALGALSARGERPRGRLEGREKGKHRRILRAILATVDGESSNR